MTKVEIPTSQNQDVEPDRQTSEDDNRKQMPERRSTKVVWKVLYVVLCTVAVLLYGFYGENIQTKIEFYCLGLLGILVTPIIQCLCDVAEEFRQYSIRYNRDSLKLVKDCFSAVKWKTIILVAVLNVVLLGSIRAIRNVAIVTLDDLMYILSGLVFGPLVTYLLNLNALSNVGLSRLIEKLGWHPVQTLAWDYFFHIERRIPMFAERFISSNLSVQEQSDAVQNPDRDRHTKIQIHLKKLILLVSDSFKMRLTLQNLDNDISEISSDDRCPELPIYGLRWNGKEYKYVILCLEEPLETIRKACDSEVYKFLYGDNPKDHMDLFCNELSKILARPGYEFYKNMCILVSTTKVTNSQLQKGWLVKVIMEHIEVDQGPPTTVVNIGRQPQGTIDIGGQNCTTSSNHIKDKKQYKSQDYFNLSDNSDENSFLLDKATSKNILKRDIDPLNLKLKPTKNRRITKSKSNTHQHQSSAPKANPDPPSNSSKKYDVRMQSTTSVLSEKQTQEEGKIFFNSTDGNVRYKKEDDLIFADGLDETSSLSGEDQPNIFDGGKAPLVLPFPKSETNEQHVPDELDKSFEQLKSDPPEPGNANPLLLPPSYFVGREVKYEEKCSANDDAPVSDRAILAKSQAICGGHETDEKETTVVNIGRQLQEGIDNGGQNCTISPNDVKEKPCNSQDYFNPSENLHENSFLLNTATNENILRDQNPLNPKLERTKNRRATKSKSNTHQSSAPKANPHYSSNSSKKYDVRMQSTTSVLSEKRAQENGKISFSSADGNVQYKKEDDPISADDLDKASSLPGEEQPSLAPSYFVAGEVKHEEKCGANGDAPVSNRAVQAKSQAKCGGHEIGEKENCLKEDKDIKHMHGL